MHHKEHGNEHPHKSGQGRRSPEGVDHQGDDGQGHHHVAEVAENWREHVYHIFCTGTSPGCSSMLVLTSSTMSPTRPLM